MEGNRASDPAPLESSLFIGPDLSAALLARLFIVLPGPKDFQSSFALKLLFEPPQRFLQGFVFADQDFGHSGRIIPIPFLKSIFNVTPTLDRV